MSEIIPLSIHSNGKSSLNQILDFCRERLFPEIRLTSLWIAPIRRQQKYRLIVHDWIDHPQVQLIELYRHTETSRRYARIYFHPLPTYVPSLIIGAIHDLAPIAQRTGATLVEFNHTDQMTIQSDALGHSPISLTDLPIVDEVTKSNKRLFYLIRPCSFVLKRVDYYRITSDQVVKIKYYANELSEQKKFFIRITLNSTSTYWKEHNCFGFVLTNCHNYMNNHLSLYPWQNLIPQCDLIMPTSTCHSSSQKLSISTYLQSS